MSAHASGRPLRPPAGADVGLVANDMLAAVSYLEGVATDAGFHRVTRRLAAARAELRRIAARCPFIACGGGRP